MGTIVCQCCDGTLPYSGAVDELDLWNRALTDVEIAAIYQAGTNHIGKATPVSIFPNCEFLVNGVTNTIIIAPASSANWLTNTRLFHRPRLQHHRRPPRQSPGPVVRRFPRANPGQSQLRPARRTAGPVQRPKPLRLLDARCLGHAHRLGLPDQRHLAQLEPADDRLLHQRQPHRPDQPRPLHRRSVAANNIVYFAFDVPAGTVSTPTF